MTYHPRITAIGAYVPERILSNDDLSRIVDTNDEWIVRRTGMKNRRIAGPDEYTSDLLYGAVLDLQRRYAVSLDDVDLVLACTHTPDYLIPITASRIQQRLGLSASGALDLNAVCAGFVYGLQTAGAFIASGMYKKVLVTAGDTMSKVVDYTDRTTCVLFGDGAGAALVERGESASFLAHESGSYGSGGIHVNRSGLSDQMDGQPLLGGGKVVQNGREVYRYAVSLVPDAIARLADQAGISLSDINWFVPHSANLRMIESICEKSGFPLERTLYSLVEYGNTSAATIPLSICMGLDNGQIKEGDSLMLYGFGGGLTHAGLLLRWTA